MKNEKNGCIDEMLLQYDTMAESIKIAMFNELMNIVKENDNEIDFMDDENFGQMYTLDEVPDEDECDMIESLSITDDGLIVSSEFSGEQNFMHLTFAKCRLIYEAIKHDFLENKNNN